jgi:integrase
MGEMHIVPLARQTLALLEELKPLCGNSSYLFPSQNRQKNPYMSENTINMVIKKMGYGGKLVGHGFRALASTTLNEVGHFMPDVIERQLAHMERDGVRAAYNRAQYMSQRKQMMQWWADYIDSLMN